MKIKSSVTRAIANLASFFCPGPNPAKKQEMLDLSAGIREQQKIAVAKESLKDPFGRARRFRGGNPCVCTCVQRGITSPSLCAGHRQYPIQITGDQKWHFCRKHRVYTCLTCGVKDRPLTLLNRRKKLVVFQRPTRKPIGKAATA